MSRFVPLGVGLRPFFLLAGIDAILNMGLWLVVYFHPGFWPVDAVPAMYWHSHEMLFGFVAAAIGGFLLTAVPGWTGEKSYMGWRLGVLVAIWMVGRIAMLPFLSCPPISVAVIDLAFFPALVAVLSPPLIRSRKMRNIPFVALLTMLFAANLVFHLGRLNKVAGGELIALVTTIGIVQILIVVIGGRIIPAFTKSGLSRHGIAVEVNSNSWLETAAIVAIVAVLFCDVFASQSAWSGAIALTAAALQGVRLAQWKGYRALRDPLIWVLHLGYAWLVIGLALKGLWLLTAVPFAEKWLHALTVGAFATMILAVMSRASLGHTGRALIAPAPIAAAYLLVSLAAAIRVFGPVIAPSDYNAIVLAAGGCWIAAFATFLLIYTPILMRSRADGKAD
jgi:uncharacterized protein involved in response to NO